MRNLPVLVFTLVISLASAVGAFGEEISVARHVGRTSQGVFDETGLWIIGAGSAATLIAFQFDKDVHRTWKGHQRMSREVSDFGDFWGTGIPEALLIGGQIYFDKLNGVPALEGFLMGGVVVHASKLAVGRARPDSGTRTAMPSGHAQAAFSIAASMTESYGWRAGLPFWGLGVFTGLTRLADNAHWLSDVVAGATVGILFGRAGYKHHRQIQPMVIFNGGRPDGAAVALNAEW